MASWLTGRVASLVKEPRQALPAADEAQQTLEQRARALTSPHSAAWLLSHWLEQCNSSEVYVQCQGSSGSQGGARTWQLSFQQVLLRSSAFELVLEVCAKVPSVREALTPGPAAASALLEQSKSLRQALHGMAERLLLPGALEVWPSLFDALLSRDAAGALPWDSWARRLVAALKKPWRLESLWPQLRRWDTAAAEELGGSDTASSTTLKATAAGAQGLSKQGIRAELIRRRFPQLALEAGRLRSRSEALCDGLEALRTVDGMGGVSCKEIEQLIQDASLALDSLDCGVQGSRDEARQLGQALSDAGSAVQRQMATVMLTQETFVARRGQLQNEKEQLAKRLQELDAEVTQLDQEASRCNQQIRQLQAQFSHNTSHYDGLLGGSAAFSEELGDRKAKAMAFRDCAAAALNVAKAAEAKQRAELETQRRRRASDLRRQVAAYVRKERTRLQAAAEFAELVAGAQPGRGTGTNPVPREPRDAAEELMEATVLAQEVWRSVQVLLQRVDALGENRADSEVIASSSEMLASSAESQAFFLKAAEEDLCVCADCSALGSEWASVSYGIYLCVDCAGQHRGLGVHLSFVRSLAMDRWTPSQLRRMELGGSLRFRDFLAPFGLCDSSDSSLHARYSSRAASFYRRRLDAECRGQAFGDVPPSREEGRQIADPATFTAEEIETATDGEGESLAAERQQLEEFDSSIHLVEEAVHQLLKERGVDRPFGKLRFRHVPRALAARSLWSLKEIRYSLVGKFITASGLVARIGVVKAVAATRSFQCAACRRSFSVASLGTLGHEAPHCPGGDGLFCGSTDLQELGGTMIDYQEIRLQDVVPGSVGTTLKVILVADLAGSAVPGDIVVVGGILRAIWPRSRGAAELVLDASDVRHSKEVPSRSRSLFLGAPSDAMAQRAELLRSVAPSLQGLEVPKLALLLALVGAGPYNPPVAGEVERWSRFMPEDENDATSPMGKNGIQEAKMRLSTHLLFVGDAATGKTKLIEAAADLSAHGVCCSAIGATRSGLTVACVRDGAGWSLEAGALSLADGGICCIDEFRHLAAEEKAALYEAMEQQTISVAKPGLTCRLRARCSVVAAQSWADPDGASLIQVTGLPAPLLSRFDLILGLRGARTRDEELAEAILGAGDPTAVGQALRFQTLKDFVAAAQECVLRDSPDDSARKVLETYYQKLRGPGLGRSSGEVSVTARSLESLIRLSRAHARLMRRHGSVQLQDAVAVVFLHQVCWRSHSPDSSQVLLSENSFGGPLCPAHIRRLDMGSDITSGTDYEVVEGAVLWSLGLEKDPKTRELREARGRAGRAVLRDPEAMLGASNCGESTRMPHAVMAIPAVPSSWTGHFAQLQEEAEEEEEDLPWFHSPRHPGSKRSLSHEDVFREVFPDTWFAPAWN
ncbi:Mcm9 [Symbiodinium sp. CCMP2456]|nr:Mcm9 [Symbiodinium sp. CCMP2456]